jgi:transmembrane sensor
MKNQIPDFSSYTLQDLLDNPYFLSWILNPVIESDNYWEKVLLTYPALNIPAKEAREIILSLKYETSFMETAEIETLWQNIEEHLLESNPIRIIPLWLRRIAAILITGTLISICFYTYQHRYISVSTLYGQTQKVVLPDGSEVMLNANTKLYYAANWNSDQPRQVWINGEGFFKVNHLHKTGRINPGERFIVHAQNTSIEVLGTTFDVNDRRKDVAVALITGKISFDFLGRRGIPTIMRPGDLILYNRGQDTITRKRIDALHAEWKNGILHFDQTSASDIFLYIEDIYGYKAIFKRPETKEKKLTGTFSNSNMDALLKAIATSLNLNIQKDSDAHQLIIN